MAKSTESGAYDWRKRGKKELHHIEVHESENGVHVVQHHFSSNGMEVYQPEDHVFGEHEGEEMLDHIAKNVHMKRGSEEGETQ